MSNATIVEFQTSHGNFQVSLHDKTTPKTVTNFLNYVKSERYNQTLFHRSIPNFVLQGGGFYFDGTADFKGIETDDSVKNEPVYSNVRATIAMAKIGGLPDSATSQWFINVKDNSQGSNGLDLQNEGFTVFGEVIGDGMNVIDLISALPRCGEVPVNDNAQAQCQSPSEENLVTLYQVVIVDDSEDTAQTLKAIKNTLITQKSEQNSSSSGGSAFWLLLLLPLARLLRA